MPTIDDWISIATLAVAAAAFCVGLWQWRKAQQWKRVEWVAQEMHRLMDVSLVRAAIMMIDWDQRLVPLPDHDSGALTPIYVDDATVAAALRPHGPDVTFAPPQAEIRDAFDVLIDGLERFASYIEVGLVKASDLTPYLRYWATRLHDSAEGPPGGPAHSTLTPASALPSPVPIQMRRIEAIHTYMRTYGQHRALRLLRVIHGCDRPGHGCPYGAT